jgi:hypothetical protein
MLGADITSDPWPGCGEQDIMEWVQSYTPTTTSSTVHGPGYSGANGIGAEYTFPNGGRVDDNNYHVYGVIWSQNSLQYYRDSPSNVFKTVTSATIPAGDQWVFNNPFFLLLNLAIGDGGFPGSTDGSTPSSAEMLVDYVRAYQSSATRNLNGTHTLTPQNATGLRLDDQGASTASGNPIDVFPSNGTGAQSWTISSTNVAPAGYHNLQQKAASVLLHPAQQAERRSYLIRVTDRQLKLGMRSRPEARMNSTQQTIRAIVSTCAEMQRHREHWCRRLAAIPVRMNNGL